MIDAVPAAARSPALEAANLRDKLWMIEQLDLAAVQCRQRVPIEVVLRLLDQLVSDTGNPKGPARPFAAKTISDESLLTE